MHTQLFNRNVIRLSGADCDALLQGIITNDITLLKHQPMIFSAMLSAQGKFAHDFFVVADGDDRLIDIDESHAQALMKKLKMYKLRSKVTIEETDDTVQAAWGTPPEGDGWLADPRHAALGWRQVLASSPQKRGSSEEYEQHRLSLAIPEGSIDATERMFALELGYDQLHGVSFTKGCFVGQEPTARMHYRSVLRKGFFAVRAADANTPLPASETPIMAGDQTLGEMRSSQGDIGLAFCRMEPVLKAQNLGTEITANGQPITLSTPDYMHEKWAKIMSDSDTPNQ
jgi:folate-binding protein YgfZ